MHSYEQVIYNDFTCQQASSEQFWNMKENIKGYKRYKKKSYVGVNEVHALADVVATKFCIILLFLSSFHALTLIKRRACTMV